MLPVLISGPLVSRAIATGYSGRAEVDKAESATEDSEYFLSIIEISKNLTRGSGTAVVND